MHQSALYLAHADLFLRRATFSAAGYAAFRPTYPPALFRTVLAYQQPPTSSGTLLDLGCGHGLIAREMSPHFGRVLGIDPSAGMVKQATEMTDDPKVSFQQGTAEDLSFLDDGSVDMVVAGQAAHWFDYSRAWPELARVVKRGGSLAFWGYKDNILVGHTRANEIFDKFCYGAGEVAKGMPSMAAYWEKPGRDILRESFRAVVPPEGEWGDVKRIVYDPDRETSTVGSEEEAWLRKRLKLGEFEGYVRTFSSYRGWKDANPEGKSSDEGGGGDVIDLMMEEIVDSVPEWKALGKNWREAEFDSVWGTMIVLARRL
jgi:trans-aconitate 3-methyltransferase